jgi:hypothetical protein
MAMDKKDIQHVFVLWQKRLAEMAASLILLKT